MRSIAMQSAGLWLLQIRKTYPVSLLYPRTRQLSPRVRVFIDWAAREFAQSHGEVWN